MASRRFPDGYESQQGVFVPQGTKQTWAYNDGDSVETRILRIVETASDVTCLSLELRRNITDWPSLYHLTPKRSNLLRPIRDQIRGRVLEVGAGCGAITRFLGETGADIYAVEGSARRASVARSRTRDLANVQVIADNVQNVDFGFKFQVITLIGVLEYARLFSDSDDPVTDLLVFLRSMLTPDGVLIIAIENQLGLKYFAGAVEDHMQQPFFGIHDRYSRSSVVTFGKAHLGSTLNDAGYAQLDWFFPFPDYKLTTTVFTEAAIKGGLGIDLTSMFSSSNFSDPQGAKPGGFSLDRAWPVIARNGLAADLANSFLIVCHANEQQSVATTSVLAWHYATDRHASFAKEVVVTGSAKTGFNFEPALLENVPAPDVSFSMNLKDEPLLKGESWLWELGRILNEPGWTAAQVGNWLKPWAEAVLRCDGQSGGLAAQPATVSGRFLDALPFNMIVDHAGHCSFFDLEFVSHEPIAFNYLVFRALAKSLERVTSCETPRQAKHRSLLLLVMNAAQEIGVSISIAQVQRFVQANRRFEHGVGFGEETGSKPRGRFFLEWRMKIRSRPADRLPTRIVRKAKKAFARA